MCLQCQTKTRGHWTCAQCQKRLPVPQFSTFSSKRSSGKNGTQTCNACYAVLTQAAVRKRAAISSILRLEPLRKKLRQIQILRATWEAIALHRQKHRPTPVTSEQHHVARAEDATTKAEMPPPQKSNSPMQKLYAYQCPYCQRQVTSHVATGQVEAPGQHCGTRFRVHHGEVSRRFFHICPTCRQEVPSSKPLGQIRVSHKKPNGKKCPTESWQAKQP